MRRTQFFLSPAGFTLLFMAGQVRTRKTLERLDEVGEEEIFATCVEIGTWIGTARHYGTSRKTLDLWVKAGGDERKAKKAEALKAGAETLFEEGAEILDDVQGRVEEGKLVTGPEIQLANSRANYRMKMAQARDRETFGDSPSQVNVNLDFGGSHLQALMKFGKASLAPVQEPELLPPAEIVEE